MKEETRNSRYIGLLHKELTEKKEKSCETCVHGNCSSMPKICISCFMGYNYDEIMKMKTPVELLPEKSCYNCEWAEHILKICTHDKGCMDHKQKENWCLLFMEEVEVEI